MNNDTKNNSIEAENRLKEKYSDEAIKNINALGDVLRRIHNRLDKEGYFLSDGKTWDIFKIGRIVCELILEEGDISYK